jgi:uncharacterized protein YeaO (DUF488 family)
MLKLKRAYEPKSRSDGTRLLVERLWPRGLSKAELRSDAWLKDVGPSTALRQWFNHDPDKWPTFRARHFRELGTRPDAWRPILSASVVKWRPEARCVRYRTGLRRSPTAVQATLREHRFSLHGELVPRRDGRHDQ